MRLSIVRLLVPAFLASQTLALPTSQIPSSAVNVQVNNDNTPSYGYNLPVVTAPGMTNFEERETRCKVTKLQFPVAKIFDCDCGWLDYGIALSDTEKLQCDSIDEKSSYSLMPNLE